MNLALSSGATTSHSYMAPSFRCEDWRKEMVEALKEKPKREAAKGIEPKWLKKFPNITRGQVVQLFCRECMGYTKHRGGGRESQNWVKAGQMAKDCTDPKCPLYIFRPGRKRELRPVQYVYSTQSVHLFQCKPSTRSEVNRPHGRSGATLVLSYFS